MNDLNPHPNAHPDAGAYTNARQIAAEMTKVAEQMPERVAAVTTHYTMLLETKIKANASGRPGPRRRTGDYVRSWTSQVTKTPGDGATGIVGTNKPQARRLEYGFVGPDRLGRVYNQPPFPHVGPAVDTIGPQFVTAIANIGAGD